MIILLWIVIGLGAGWMIGALMLGKDSRRSSELSAGLIGAFLGPLVLQLSDPVVRLNELNGSFAALAGALCSLGYFVLRRLVTSRLYHSTRRRTW